MKGNRFASLSWDNFNELSQSHITIIDTDLCEDTDHIEEFAININNDLTWMGENEF